ncbi:MAG: glycosyltransferase family 4 protein [Deltaproteobacteria bacterium]|nr:glycosyltransferase family 4 protein [Deltaproteobacteria bacterium]
MTSSRGEPGAEPGARSAWRIFFATRVPLHFVLGRLDRVVAVSNATRDELREGPCVTVPVEVVANGVDLPRGRATDTSSARQRGPILYVGRLDPYKNVSAWLQEYAGLPEGIRRTHPLVLCGDHDPRFAEPLRTAAAEAGIADQVDWRGHVTEGELDVLYREAALLVHPSLEEGFGLTLLEAMARGTPVVAYRIPALAEVGGDAVCFAEPGEPGALVRCVRRLLESPEERSRLAALGFARAEEFSWRRCAVATREVHRRVLESTVLRRCPASRAWSAQPMCSWTRGRPSMAESVDTSVRSCGGCRSTFRAGRSACWSSPGRASDSPHMGWTQTASGSSTSRVGSTAWPRWCRSAASRGGCVPTSSTPRTTCCRRDCRAPRWSPSTT